MKTIVYIETSVISYLTSRPTADPIKSAWQAVTAQWWNTKLTQVTACVSPYVIEEISAGDPQAAQQRIKMIRPSTVLDTNDQIEARADFLLLGGGLPPKARFDALHIACAAFHNVNVVMTWNFKHIANPVQLPVMRGLCAARGFRLPELVSPLEMMESQQ
ncbi:MAG: type II toxin-antitoxin system VapC family toxin [Rhizobacter sp.]|nr:type II toxin-antitoxin system VapC family toxin [Burkholderiales bacterium]